MWQIKIYLLVVLGTFHSANAIKIGQGTYVDRKFGEISATKFTKRNDAKLVIFDVRGGALSHQSSSVSLEKFLTAIDFFGTGVFAFSGALTAGKKGMDIVGMLTIAVITAAGGGTLRDLLLDSGPVFWMRNPVYFHICVVVTLATYLIWPELEEKMGWKDSAKCICVADALGIGYFTVLGAQKAANAGLPPIMWIVVGVMSSIFGGIIRDIVIRQDPRSMYPHRTLYAAQPILGGALYTSLTNNLNMSKEYAASISFFVIVTTRILSFKSPLRLPHWKMYA